MSETVEPQKVIEKMLESLETIHALALVLEQQYLKLEKTPHKDVAGMEAELLQELQATIKRLRIMDSLLVGDLKKLIPEKVLDLPSGGQVEIKTGVARKTWNKQELCTIVVEKIMEDARDPETGAFEVPISQMLMQVFDFVSFSNWKVTALRDAGIDPNKYSEMGNPSTSAQFRR